MNARHLSSFLSLVSSVVLAVLVGLGVVAFLDGRRSATARPLEAEAIAAAADLSITQTNNLTQVVPGTQVIYSITISNPSSEVVTNAAVVDSASPSFLPQRFSYSGVNAIAQGVTFTGGQPIRFFATFGPGGFLNVLVTGTLSANATGTLTNTASIAPPADVTDPNLSNNTATDSDPIVSGGPPMADVQISKTDGVTQVKTAQALSYTVLITNAGPMAVNGVQITDVLPSGFQASNASVSFSGAEQRGLGLSAAGVLTATYDMLPGGRVMIVVHGVVMPVVATTEITNTATVTLPLAAIDPNPANNSAVDVDLVEVLRRVYVPVVRKPSTNASTNKNE
jgi:uncharacterized repeat protein (TIGR01451 family)